MIEQLQHSAGHLIRRAHQLHDVIFGEVTAGCDITSPQYAALCAIAEFPGIEQTALSDLIAYDRSTIGGLIDRLESKGLVRRTVGVSDRRCRRLDLTNAGTALLRELRIRLPRVQERMLEALAPAQRRIFLALLERVVGLNRAHGTAPARLPRKPDAAPRRTTAR